jgi:hypothetical protein
MHTNAIINQEKDVDFFDLKKKCLFFVLFAKHQSFIKFYSLLKVVIETTLFEYQDKLGFY